VNRVRCLGFLAGAVAFLALAVPGSALAGTYTWDLASDFTATAPGANPDHDPYGATPWNYVEGSSASTDPSTFSPLTTFTDSGNPATWSDPGTGALVGYTPSQITYGKATLQPGAFVEPGSAGQVVAVGWTSPLSQTATVSINASIFAEAGSTPSCTYSTAWTLVVNGTARMNGTLVGGTASTSFSTPATVAPGASIFVAVSNAGDPTCDATGLSLNIEGNVSAGPPVTLTTPASGSSTTLDKPPFAGAAGASFGDGSQVILRVYSGGSVSGAPLEVVTVPRSGASWSAQLSSPLPLGTYTAQAEQDDIATPADAGLSAPVTFTVRVPAITLDPLGSKPLTISTPTLTGTADSDIGSDPFAVVEVFSGDAATGTPVAKLTTGVSPSGGFSVQVAPALADGTYTAVAAQADVAGSTGVSAPQTFEIDTQPPPVTLLRPAAHSRADLLQLVFTGTAGTASFDSSVVSVILYRGKSDAGKRIGTTQAKVTGSTWSAKWPGKLASGVYTALASQSDAVGHIGLSPAHTFRVLPLPPVIGGAATIDRAGRVSVQIACNEPAGDTCSGTILVLTRGKYQPLAGGPVGRLTVMFAYVHIAGGHTPTITRTVLPSVEAVLHRQANVAVTISANLRPVQGKAIHATTRASLRRVGT
jgi:hypothetical protein